MFKLKLVLVIGAILDDRSVQFVSKDGFLPSIMVEAPTNNQTIDKIVGRLFSEITRLMPSWANLKRNDFNIENDTIVISYTTILSQYDILYNNYEWSCNLNETESYNLCLRRILSV